MSDQHMDGNENCPIEVPCEVRAESKTPLSDAPFTPIVTPGNPIMKVPVVLAERTIQIVVESDIPLDPPAVEVKRVLKDAFLTQCKLVPVAFAPTDFPGISRVTRGKLFIEGYIRKNIEYATDSCNAPLRSRIANVPFSGFADLTEGDFLSPPILGASSQSRAAFIDPHNSELPRFDKYFFQNSVYYNEQPFCELVRADFYELDFSPCPVDFQDGFDRLREKIVLDLTVKVLQVQQVRRYHGG